MHAGIQGIYTKDEGRRGMSIALSAPDTHLHTHMQKIHYRNGTRQANVNQPLYSKDPECSFMWHTHTGVQGVNLNLTA